MIKDIKLLIKELLNYKKNKKQKRRQLQIFFVFFLFFIISLFIISLSLSKKIFQQLEYSPEKTTKADTFQGEIFFNSQKASKTFEKTIAESLESAQTSIDIAMYSFNVFALKRDLYRAHDRGIKINIILSENKNAQHKIVFDDLPEGISLQQVGSQDTDDLPQYMHHKFIIIDKDTDNRQLITGSVNLTEYQILFDPSYLLVTSDAEIIATYAQEFTRLQNGYSGPDKLKLLDYKPWAKRINYTDSFFDIYFSPGFKGNNINRKIEELIKTAEKDIKVMAWQASDLAIARALVLKAQEGIGVKIIVDDTNFADRYSIFPYILKAKQQYQLNNLEIVTDTWKSLDLYENIPNELVGNDFFNSFFHHHALIIDNELVLFGTNNWSNMGSNINDENTMITNNQYIVNSFIDIFNHHYQDLRQQMADITIVGQTVNISQEIVEQYLGSQVSIFSFSGPIYQASDICHQTLELNNSELSTNCDFKFFDIYIHDNNGQIQAGNILYKQ
jgi:phosphatidylserine/phosphatidylglycerophosphate/cardiolipin synthase-like enzyme